MVKAMLVTEVLVPGSVQAQHSLAPLEGLLQASLHLWTPLSTVGTQVLVQRVRPLMQRGLEGLVPAHFSSKSESSWLALKEEMT